MYVRAETKREIKTCYVCHKQQHKPHCDRKKKGGNVNKQTYRNILWNTTWQVGTLRIQNRLYNWITLIVHSPFLSYIICSSIPAKWLSKNCQVKEEHTEILNIPFLKHCVKRFSSCLDPHETFNQDCHHSLTLSPCNILSTKDSHGFPLFIRRDKNTCFKITGWILWLVDPFRGYPALPTLQAMAGSLLL